MFGVKRLRRDLKGCSDSERSQVTAEQLRYSGNARASCHSSQHRLMPWDKRKAPLLRVCASAIPPVFQASWDAEVSTARAISLISRPGSLLSIVSALPPPSVRPWASSSRWSARRRGRWSRGLGARRTALAAVLGQSVAVSWVGGAVELGALRSMSSLGLRPR